MINGLHPRCVCVFLRQIDKFVVIGGLSMFALGMLLVVALMQGFWDEVVEDNTVTVRRLWVFKKTFNISDIEYCKARRGGINVYVNGQKAFQIDSMSTNTSNFIKRMEKEGIEVR